MRFFAFLLCASFASAALVKREAEAAAEADPVADPEAEPVYGLNVNGGYAEPVCTLTPVKTCKPVRDWVRKGICSHTPRQGLLGGEGSTGREVECRDCHTCC